MKIHKHIVAAALITLVGCASTHRGRAIQVGTVAKEVVDGGVKITRTYLDAKAEECSPVVERGTIALEACLGPVASKPDEVDSTFEAVRSAQLALYIAVSADADPAATKAARQDLESAVREVVKLIQTIRAEEGK